MNLFFKYLAKYEMGPETNSLAEVIIGNHHKWADYTIKLDQNHTQLKLLLRPEFGLLFQRGHNLTSVQRHLSNNHCVQLNCRDGLSVKTPSKLLRVECMRMHFSYLNSKTSKVQINPLSDVMLL